jgi:heat shock protein HslJ
VAVRALQLLVAGSVGLVCACGGDANDGEDLHVALVGRTFVSESVEGWQLVQGTEVRIQFRERELMASAGCNSVDGQYDIDGSVLELSGYGSTDMGCDPERHAQDAWLIEFLLARPSLELSEPRLVMSTGDARMTLLDREVASPDRPLVGTLWRGDGFSDGTMVTSMPGVALVSAWFDPDGSVEVHTSCQVGVGAFHLEGTSIAFEGLAYDGAPCADPSYQGISDRVMLVFDGAPVAYQIEEASLEISQGSDAVLFRASE